MRLPQGHSSGFSSTTSTGQKTDRSWRGGHTSYKAQGARQASVAPENGEQRGEEGKETIGAGRAWEDSISESREVGEQRGRRLTTDPLEREYRDRKGFSQCSNIVKDDRLMAILKTLLTHKQKHAHTSLFMFVLFLFLKCYFAILKCRIDFFSC